MRAGRAKFLAFVATATLHNLVIASATGRATACGARATAALTLRCNTASAWNLLPEIGLCYATIVIVRPILQPIVSGFYLPHMKSPFYCNLDYNIERIIVFINYSIMFKELQSLICPKV